MDERLSFLVGERLPAAWVNLNSLDANARRLAEVVRQARPDLTIRVASKSLRVPALLKRALAADPIYRGLMCYSAEEAVRLSALGFDDLLVAYPTLQPEALKGLVDLHARGKKVSLVADSVEGLAALSSIAVAYLPKGAAQFPVLVEPDLSQRLGSVVLGVRRSPLRTTAEVVALCTRVRDTPGLRFQGLMAYEAQVAGLADRSPVKSAWLNRAAGVIRARGARYAAAQRADLVAALRERGLAPELVNGGGTGSLTWAAHEACLTEVTAGSGLVASHLFDGYSNLALDPALHFALEAVRRPAKNWITCAGGGYVASGEAGVDRLPRPTFARDAELSPTEGCGEVQTPVRSREADRVALGAPVAFRPTKAGELAERFSEYLLVQDGRIVERVPTYRGLGWCFF